MGNDGLVFENKFSCIQRLNFSLFLNKPLCVGLKPG